LPDARKCWFSTSRNLLGQEPSGEKTRLAKRATRDPLIPSCYAKTAVLSSNLRHSRKNLPVSYNGRPAAHSHAPQFAHRRSVCVHLGAQILHTCELRGSQAESELPTSPSRGACRSARDSWGRKTARELGPELS
jgi:hypothetical protein